MKCPCHSKKSYQECCKPFHEGRGFPETAEQLMRSRYSAYALKKFDYINKTASKISDVEELRKSYQNMQFLNLEILETTEDSVTFRATLKRNGEDCSFTEKSRFLKSHGHWIYLRE